MHLTAFVNARIVFETRVHEGCVIVRDGAFAGVHIGACPIPHDSEVVDCGGRYLAPGLIDVHVHGGGGHSLMTDDPDEVRAYARWVARHGVTGFLISTSGSDHAAIVRRLEALAPMVGHEPGAARVLGFHLEGPYINAARKGAFPAPWLRPPDVDEYWELVAASDKQVRQVTLAPELPGGDALIEAVLGSGAVAAIGHTDASYDEAMRAFELGVTHVTHCFNAMRPFSHRDPGCLAAIMERANVTAELIGDGAHVDYAAARILLRAKEPQNIVLVTDGMTLAGTDDGDASWEGQRIRVEGGKAVRIADNTIIGGVITLDQTMRNAVKHLGVPLATAVAMASTHAARAMRVDDRYGAIAPGLAADFALLDDDLNVHLTYVGGHIAGG
jgi:N-acetylglucosamine-6-phosphate deacetylase